MPKIAALEFEDNLVRVLVAKTAGAGFKLSSAFEVELDQSWEDESTDLGKSLAKAVGSQTGRCDALVSFGRGQSELRVINVPVVPADELPDIVRFQAQRQFTNAADDSPVDYLPLTETAEEKKVLAATVARAAIQRIVSSCQTAGLNVKEVKLRATCTAALSQSIHPDGKNYIVVEPTDKSFNVEVVAYGKLCLTRTVRASSADVTDQIIRDIRRTLAAANNQIPGYETRKILVFGHEDDFQGLRSAVESELQFDVEFINPFDHADGLRNPPTNAGHYASLIGLLKSHCSPSTETIDFLNPRKRETAGSNRRVALLAGIAAAVLVFGLVGLGYLLLSQKSSQIARIREEISARKESDLIAQELIGDVEKIEAFDNTQAVWLKELAVLSERSMDPDQLILNSTTFTLDLAKKGGGIKIEADGYLQSGAVSEQLGNRIRELEKYDATLENVVLLSEKEKDQEIYSHKFKARVNRAPEILIPEISPEELKAFMEPRIAIGQKELDSDDHKKKGDPPPAVVPDSESEEQAAENNSSGKEKSEEPDPGKQQAQPDEQEDGTERDKDKNDSADESPEADDQEKELSNE